MKWHPIETAPKDGTDILVLSVCGIIYQARWGLVAANKQFRWIHKDGWFPAYKSPTHWIPLPEPPKDGDNGQQ